MPDQICPVCQVRISGDTVHFAAGEPGTRDRLYARVCQYAIACGKTGCINTQKPSETALHRESWGHADAQFRYDLSRLGLEVQPLDFSAPVYDPAPKPTKFAMVLGCVEAHLRRLAEAVATIKGLA